MYILASTNGRSIILIKAQLAVFFKVYYRAHTKYDAKVMFSEFLSFCSQGGGGGARGWGGGPGICIIWLMSQGLSTF